MNRWTIKELNEISDIDFAICELNGRKITNPYSPLAEKLRKTVKTLEKLKQEHKPYENQVLK